MAETLRTPQWWLAEISQYGNAKLCDGPHSDEAGAREARYLYHRLNLEKGRTFAVAKVELFDAPPTPVPVNEEVIKTLTDNCPSLRPESASTPLPKSLPTPPKPRGTKGRKR